MKESTGNAWISAFGLVVLVGFFLFIFHELAHPSHPRRKPDYCIANLKQIEGAIEQWALENHKASNDVVTITDISGTSNSFIRALINSDKFQCPQGGIYTVTRVGEKPTCSIPGHTLGDWQNPPIPSTNRYE